MPSVTPEHPSFAFSQNQHHTENIIKRGGAYHAEDHVIYLERSGRQPMTGNKPPATIEEYLKSQPPPIRKRLKEIVAIVRAAAPDATEKLSYRMPAFFLNGFIVYFAAFKNHIGFYPGASGITAFRNEIKGYKSAKGSIQFPHDHPLPVALIKKIVKFRVKENILKAKKKKK